MPEPIDSPIVQALRALTGRNLFPQAPPPSQPVNAPFAPPASSWAEVQADPLKALANLVMGAVDPWGQPKGMNTGSIGGLLGAALPLASLARGAEAGIAARGTQAARGAEEAAPGIRAYHGSPHDFDKFALEKIGTGEGAQAYGHGLYFAENPQVAGEYKRVLADRQNTAFANARAGVKIADKYIAKWQAMLDDPSIVRPMASNRQPVSDAWLKAQIADEHAEKARLLSDPRITAPPQGRMYEVQINANPDHLLDWDKPLSQQPQHVQDAIGRMVDRNISEEPGWQKLTGSDVLRAAYERSRGGKGSGEAMLREAGIPGIKYFDGGSRASAGGVLDGVNQTPNGYVATIKVEGRPGAFTVPTTQFTKSPPMQTAEAARAWAEQRIAGGSRNYVIFDDSLITILKKYGVALPMIEALRRKAAANNGRLPAADVHGAIQS